MSKSATPSAVAAAAASAPTSADPAMAGSAWTGLPTPDDEDDPLLGTTLSGSYVVRRLLGEGGMGRVYEAHHTRITRKRVAIKVLRPDMAGNPEVHGRFKREAEAAACISHPNVLSVFDVDRTPQGWPYIVSELLEGVDLADHLERLDRLGPVTAIHIATQVCEALQAAHALGVIHRDLKPQNIFLVGDFASGGPPLRPMVKVLDFGLSRFLDSSNDSSLTRAGVVMGTPSYMSPEQARGQRADHLADVYGVGALVYAMLTGVPPFAEETPQMTILAVMDRDPVRPRSIEPTISEHLELVIQRAMAREPADRYPDMASLKFALEPFGLAAASGGRRVTPPNLALGPRHGSRVGLEHEADTVRLARPRLVLFLGLAIVGSAFLLATMLAGVAVLTGWLTFSRTELTLLLLAAIGTSLTPAVLVLRRLRSEVWHNSARVLVSLEQVRAPLLAAFIAFGLATLAVRFIDEVVARYAVDGLLGRPGGVAWPGWNLLLPAIAILAAGTELLRIRLHDEEAGRLRRALVGPGLFAGLVLVSAAALVGGLQWRHAIVPAAAPSVIATESAPPTKLPDGAAASTSAAPIDLDAVPPPEHPKKVRRAPDEELAEAIDKGVEGLLPLSERYPEDPQVLRALTMAFASRATGRVDAMTVAKRLFAIAPETRQDTDMRVLVARAAATPGRAGDLAFEIMASHMGTAGPDLLYELMLTKPSLSSRAEKTLDEPAVVRRSTPALKIARELRAADNCEERVPLLDRAAQLGDERALMILQPLTVGSKKGCGKWRHLPCPAPCAKQATAYRKAITEISERLRQNR